MNPHESATLVITGGDISGQRHAIPRLRPLSWLWSQNQSLGVLKASWACLPWSWDFLSVVEMEVVVMGASGA